VQYVRCFISGTNKKLEAFTPDSCVGVEYQTRDVELKTPFISKGNLSIPCLPPLLRLWLMHEIRCSIHTWRVVALWYDRYLDNLVSAQCTGNEACIVGYCRDPGIASTWTYTTSYKSP